MYCLSLSRHIPCSCRWCFLCTLSTSIFNSLVDSIPVIPVPVLVFVFSTDCLSVWSVSVSSQRFWTSVERYLSQSLHVLCLCRGLCHTVCNCWYLSRCIWLSLYLLYRLCLSVFCWNLQWRVLLINKTRRDLSRTAHGVPRFDCRGFVKSAGKNVSDPIRIGKPHEQVWPPIPHDLRAVAGSSEHKMQVEKAKPERL
jgi:hypothetical protein